MEDNENKIIGAVSEAPKSKLQPAIEYLTTFGASLLLITIVIAVIGLFILNSKTTTNTQSTCYISAQLNCIQIAISSNNMHSTALLEFTNNLGTALTFPENAITIYPTSTQVAYEGMCFPSNAVQGATVICNATLSGYNPALGTQLQPRFQISYNECVGTQCNTFNTTGSSTLYVSSNIPISVVQLIVNPSNGKISVNGNPYPSGTTVDFIGSGLYNLYASVSGLKNAIFKGWVTQGGTFVTNSLSQTTKGGAAAPGTIIATFAYPITIEQQPSAASASWDAYFVYQSSQSSGTLVSQGYPAPGTNLGVGYDYGGVSTATYDIPIGSSIVQICTQIANPFSYRYVFTDWSNSYISDAACSAVSIPVVSQMTIIAQYNVPGGGGSPGNCGAYPCSGTSGTPQNPPQGPCYPLTLSTNPSSGEGSLSASPSSSAGCPAASGGVYWYTADTAVTISESQTYAQELYTWDTWSASGGDSYYSGGSTTYTPPQCASATPCFYSGTGTSSTIYIEGPTTETANYYNPVTFAVNTGPSGTGDDPSGYWFDCATDSYYGSGSSGQICYGSGTSGPNTEQVPVYSTINYACMSMNPAHITESWDGMSTAGYWAWGGWGGSIGGSNPCFDPGYIVQPNTPATITAQYSPCLTTSADFGTEFSDVWNWVRDQNGADWDCVPYGTGISIALRPPGSWAVCGVNVYTCTTGLWYDGWVIDTASYTDTNTGAGIGGSSACNVANYDGGDLPLYLWDNAGLTGWPITVCTLPTFSIVVPTTVYEPFDPCYTAEPVSGGGVSTSGSSGPYYYPSGFQFAQDTRCLPYGATYATVDADPDPGHTFSHWNCYDGGMEYHTIPPGEGTPVPPSSYSAQCYGDQTDGSTGIDYGTWGHQLQNGGTFTITQPTLEFGFFN